MRNPLKRLARRDPDRLTLKQRAAALRATAARVVRKRDSAPPPVDWHNPPPGFMAYPALDPQGFITIPEGLRLETLRLHGIALAEFERHAAEISEDQHAGSIAGAKDRLRRRLRLDALAAAADPERPVHAGDVDRTGTVYYEDAAGKTYRGPVAHWIAFTAQRLYSVAMSEKNRQFNAGCRDLDGAGCEALEARLRRELRTDALFALAFHSQRVFEAAEAERQGEPAGDHRDPILAAVRAADDAQLAIDRFYERVDGRNLMAGEHAEESGLCAVESDARDVVLATLPTTRHGQILLLEWVRGHIDACGCTDGTPADGHETVWADAYRCLAAALSAPPVPSPEGWARGQADAVNLSGLGAARLSSLFDAFTRAADAWSDASCLPYAEDEAASRVLDDEYGRAAMIRDRIVGLIRTRSPADDRERDAILDVLIRHEIMCEGSIQDRALLARVTAAWGAPARG